MTELNHLDYVVFHLKCLLSLSRLTVTYATSLSHVVPSYSATAPDLHVSVCELTLCVSQLSFSVCQALLQRLHLPLHLLLVLSDGHF